MLDSSTSKIITVTVTIVKSIYYNKNIYTILIIIIIFAITTKLRLLPLLLALLLD